MPSVMLGGQVAGRLGSLVSLTVAAMFFSHASVSGALHAGSITVTRVGPVDVSLSPSSHVFTVSEMAPGDTVTRRVEVENTGDRSLTYEVRVTVSDSPLGDALSVSAEVSPANCPLRLGDTPGSNRLGAGDIATVCLTVSLPREATVDVSGSSAQVEWAFIAQS